MAASPRSPRFLVRKLALFGWSVLDTAAPDDRESYGFEAVAYFGYHDDARAQANADAARREEEV